MIDEINTALDDYMAKWQTLQSTRTDKQFFDDLKPVAVGWKVADRAEYDRVVAALHDQSSQIVETWMNGRWVAKLILRDAELRQGMRIVKVLQRRPGSDDTTGLDHVDFYSAEVARAETVQAAENDLKWTHESNEVIAGYHWISLWFEGTEAKLKSSTVLDIIAAELSQVNEQITRN